jgi:putative phosphoribosyl transferase
LFSAEAASDGVSFADRQDAGRRLAEQLLPLANEYPVVVALPRGGVPVAREVAAALDAPLDILAVGKLGAPHNPEYGIGEVAEDGTCVIDAEAMAALGLRYGVLDSIIPHESAELCRRVAAYRDGRPPLELKGRTVIAVDDGVATGATDMAALRALRRREPRRLILAVPVCAADSVKRLLAEASEVVCLLAPPLLYGVGQSYRDFSQVSDEEVAVTLGEFHNATT